MRCGGGCQAKISARPALRWSVPLFYAAWRTSAAATRRLQKLTNYRTSCASLVRATVLCSLADFRRRCASPPEARHLRTSCASLIRATVLCSLADFRRRTPAPEERSCAEAGHFCNNSYRLSYGAGGVFFTRERIPLPPLFPRFFLPGNGANAGKIKVAQLLSKLAVPGLAGNVHHSSVCIGHDGGIALIVPNPHAFP